MVFVFSVLLENNRIRNLLQGDGPLTLFLPTDSAFDLLDNTTLQSLQNPDKCRNGKIIKRYLRLSLYGVFFRNI